MNSEINIKSQIFLKNKKKNKKFGKNIFDQINDEDCEALI